MHPVSGGSTTEDLQRLFRGQGWNTAGANLLATSCWLAQSVFLYFRPRIDGQIDGLWVLGLTILGMGLLTPLDMGLVGAGLGFVLGGSHLLWKVSLWKPAEEIIRRDLDRVMQLELVGTLVEVCEANSLDPDDLGRLVKSLKDEKTDLNAQFYSKIVEFFNCRLKMQE